MSKEKAIRMALLALILWSSPFIIDSMVYSANNYSLPNEKAAPAPSESPPAPAPAPEPVEHGPAPPPPPGEH